MKFNIGDKVRHTLLKKEGNKDEDLELIPEPKFNVGDKVMLNKEHYLYMSDTLGVVVAREYRESPVNVYLYSVIWETWTYPVKYAGHCLERAQAQAETKPVLPHRQRRLNHILKNLMKKYTPAEIATALNSLE